MRREGRNGTAKENGPYREEGRERKGDQDDAPERVLFSIYGTFRYREMRLFSGERREDLCSSVLFTTVAGAGREKPMNGVRVRYRHGNCCSVSFYANLKQYDTAISRAQNMK